MSVEIYNKLQQENSSSVRQHKQLYKLKISTKSVNIFLCSCHYSSIIWLIIFQDSDI